MIHLQGNRRIFESQHKSSILMFGFTERKSLIKIREKNLHGKDHLCMSVTYHFSELTYLLLIDP